MILLSLPRRGSCPLLRRNRGPRCSYCSEVSFLFFFFGRKKFQKKLISQTCSSKKNQKKLGGMAAGKSTVREVVARDDLWALTRLTAAAPPVVIEADAIKATAAAARAAAERSRRARQEGGEGGEGGRRSRGLSTDSAGSVAGGAGTAAPSDTDEKDDDEEEEKRLGRFVHEYSTCAAEELLVAAVNEQRDVVFDGTMAWLPFVRATIAMVRDHGWLYRRGPGWQGGAERAIEDEDEEGGGAGGGGGEGGGDASDGDADGEPADDSIYWQRTVPAPAGHLPYRVEVVGVTCDPGLAVARGVWRRLRSGRCVPVAEQLRSHRLFAAGFARAAALADSATLFDTGSALTTLGKAAADLAPVVIAHRSAATRGEMLVSPRAWARFAAAAALNDGASAAAGLWTRKKEPQGGRRKSGGGEGGGGRRGGGRGGEVLALPPHLFPPPSPMRGGSQEEEQRMQMQQQAAAASPCAPRAGTLLAVLRAADRRERRLSAAGVESLKERESEEKSSQPS